MPSLEKAGIGERRLVKDEDGKDYYCYFVEKIDILAQRNTEKIEEILANSDNYSANDLIKVSEKNFSGVSIELRKKLAKLAIEKLTKEHKEKLPDEGYDSDKE